MIEANQPANLPGEKRWRFTQLKREQTDAIANMRTLAVQSMAHPNPLVASYGRLLSRTGEHFQKWFDNEVQKGTEAGLKSPVQIPANAVASFAGAAIRAMLSRAHPFDHQLIEQQVMNSFRTGLAPVPLEMPPELTRQERASEDDGA